MDREKPTLTPRERAFLEANPGAEIVQSNIDDAANGERPSNKPHSNNPDLVGIGGWLLVMVVLIAGGMFQRLGQTITDIDAIQRAEPGQYDEGVVEAFITQSWLMVGADAFLSLLSVYLLIARRVPSTVGIVIACLWLLGPVKVIIVLNMSGLEGDLTGYFLLSCIIPAIWTVYLLKSERVRNTYSFGTTE